MCGSARRWSVNGTPGCFSLHWPKDHANSTPIGASQTSAEPSSGMVTKREWGLGWMNMAL